MKSKKAIAEAQAKIDAQNRIFFLYEFIQRAENGGSPVPNEANLGHGEPVYIVKKRELMEFALGVRDIIAKLTRAHAERASSAEMRLVFEATDIVDRILAEDQFVAPLRKLGTPKEE